MSVGTLNELFLQKHKEKAQRKCCCYLWESLGCLCINAVLADDCHGDIHGKVKDEVCLLLSIANMWLFSIELQEWVLKPANVWAWLILLVLQVSQSLHYLSKYPTHKCFNISQVWENVFANTECWVWISGRANSRSRACRSIPPWWCTGRRWARRTGCCRTGWCRSLVRASRRYTPCRSDTTWTAALCHTVIHPPLLLCEDLKITFDQKANISPQSKRPVV